MKKGEVWSNKPMHSVLHSLLTDPFQHSVKGQLFGPSLKDESLTCL